MPNEKVFLDAFGGLTEPHQKSPYMVRDQWVEVGQLMVGALIWRLRFEMDLTCFHNTVPDQETGHLSIFCTLHHPAPSISSCMPK